jgi:hypothetical protein
VLLRQGRGVPGHRRREPPRRLLIHVGREKGERDRAKRQKGGEESGRRSGDWVYICFLGIRREARNKGETGEGKQKQEKLLTIKSNLKDLDRRMIDRTTRRFSGDVDVVSLRKVTGVYRVILYKYK